MTGSSTDDDPFTDEPPSDTVPLNVYEALERELAEYRHEAFNKIQRMTERLWHEQEQSRKLDEMYACIDKLNLGRGIYVRRSKSRLPNEGQYIVFAIRYGESVGIERDSDHEMLIDAFERGKELLAERANGDA